MLTKKCIVCGKEFTKKQTTSLSEWFGNRRRPLGTRFCSKSCVAKYYQTGKETRFKKGHTSTKGMKFPGRITTTSFKKGSIPWNKGRHWTLKERKKISDALPKRFGEKAGNWRGGKTAIIKIIRNSEKYKEWQIAVMRRDKWICKECGARHQRGSRPTLHAHHIKNLAILIDKFEIRNFEQALNCHELWDILNGITLCAACHKQTESYTKKCS